MWRSKVHFKITYKYAQDVDNSHGSRSHDKNRRQCQLISFSQWYDYWLIRIRHKFVDNTFTVIKNLQTLLLILIQIESKGKIAFKHGNNYKIQQRNAGFRHISSVLDVSKKASLIAIFQN